jgi:hypothetical protein
MLEVREEQAKTQHQHGEWVSGAEVERPLDMSLPVIDDKVIRGQDGWLFIANDTADAMGQHTGKRLLTEHQVQQWQDLLEQRSAWLNIQGIPYLCLIAPDPHAVYADKLPDGCIPGETRPVLQILDNLAERGSWAPVTYLLDAMQRDHEEEVYSQTGSHWSEYGAYIGYRELMAHLTETFPVRTLTRKELNLSFDMRAGDLGLKFDPPVKSRYVYVDVIDPRARLVRDNRVRNHGRLVEYEADCFNALTCLIFGDSYAVAMMPLLAESFQRTIWAHSYFDYELVREMQPDVVVTVVSERGMIKVQNDVDTSVRRLAASKQEAGDVMPPRKPTASLRVFGMRPSKGAKPVSAQGNGASQDT